MWWTTREPSKSPRDRSVPFSTTHAMQTTDGRGYVDVQYSHREGEWDLIARGSYDWENYHGVYIYDYTNTGPPYTQNEDLSHGTWADF